LSRVSRQPSRKALTTGSSSISRRSLNEGGSSGRLAHRARISRRQAGRRLPAWFCAARRADEPGSAWLIADRAAFRGV
jgi:hypothetical protein